MEKQQATAVRKAFGDRIREIRRKKGIAQERLALESGLNRGYLGRVERGEQNLSLVNICKIANALEVAPSTLLEWRESSVGQDSKKSGESAIPLDQLGEMLDTMSETMLTRLSRMLRETYAAGERKGRRHPGGNEPDSRE